MTVTFIRSEIGGNMKTDCEERRATFPAARMNFPYESMFSSNFHERAVKRVLGLSLPLLSATRCSVNADRSYSGEVKLVLEKYYHLLIFMGNCSLAVVLGPTPSNIHLYIAL